MRLCRTLRERLRIRLWFRSSPSSTCWHSGSSYKLQDGDRPGRVTPMARKARPTNEQAARSTGRCFRSAPTARGCCPANLNVVSRSAWVSVRRLHSHEGALYRGDTALYYEGVGRDRLSVHLGLRVCWDLATLHAAEHQQEHAGCQRGVNLSAAPANYCVGSHNTPSPLRAELTRDCTRPADKSGCQEKTLFPIRRLV